MRSPIRALIIATIVTIYVIITLGGVVRATGSGLGCPDWPKCYGDWIPPTDAADIPATVDAATVNLTKTWIEYLNRMAGVLGGLIVFAAAALVVIRRNRRGRVTAAMIIALLMFGFQGWLGGQVVKYELTAALVSAHLFLAIAIAMVLMYAAASERRYFSLTASPLALSASVVGLLIVGQLVLGTLVRERIEALEMGGTNLPRSEWLPLGWWPDIAHRQAAVLVLIISGAFVFHHRRSLFAQARTGSLAFIGLIGLQLVTGLVMAYGGLPRAGQVVHLVASTLLLTVLFGMVISTAPSESGQQNAT